MEEIGNVEYVMLSNTTCNDGSGANSASTLTWRFPYIKPQESPLMYIQAVQVYYDAGAAAVNTSTPMQLRLTSSLSENYYANDKQSPIFSLLVRDQISGHWINPNNNPILQVSTKMSYITFQVELQSDNSTFTADDNATINILLKIIRPKQMEMTKNNVATYARMLP
jgi:hypothetical protein